MNEATTEAQIQDEPAKSSYTASLEGRQVGHAQYQLSGDTILFPHTVVDSDVEGRGVGSTLIRFALDDARSRNLTVVPRCEFVAAFIDEHPQYQDLVVD